jgi:hypothetical protein
MPARSPPPIPSVFDLCPGVRRPARRVTNEVRRLIDALLAALPDAALLVRDPRLAERIDTTPHDHVAADLITSARALLRAVDGLADPP